MSDLVEKHTALMSRDHIDDLHEDTVDLVASLSGQASQENCGGDPYDTMQAAAEYIQDLRTHANDLMELIRMRDVVVANRNEAYQAQADKIEALEAKVKAKASKSGGAESEAMIKALRGIASSPVVPAQSIAMRCLADLGI